jgi:O-antigen ligase
MRSPLLVTPAALRARVPALNSALLGALFFVVPTHVAPAYFLSALILLLLPFEGGMVEKVRTLGRSPLVWIFAAYFGVFALSLLWTDDLAAGRWIVDKQKFFLLFALYLLAARREHIGWYLAAFLASIGMCVVLAWYNWGRLHYLPELPAGVQVSKGPEDTAPFVDRVMYAPMLAFAAYLLLHEWLFGPLVPGLKRRWLLLGFLLAVVANILMSGGRTGTVGLIALVALAILQKLARRPVLAASVAALAVAGVLGAGYLLFPHFQARANNVVQAIDAGERLQDQSIAQRLTYARGAARVFAENPLGGVGAGDFPDEFRRVAKVKSLDNDRLWNPHNQYLLVLSSTGVFGGTILLLMFVALLKAPTDPRDNLRRVQTAVVLLFAVICLGESYLARSNTSLLFVLVSALVARSGAESLHGETGPWRKPVALARR